jgi:uncharacterized membrane protein YeiH
MRHWFWILDALVVISFAVIGADFHGFTYQVAGILRVAAPFLIALAGGIVALKVWKKPLSILNGILLGSITLTAGMMMRGYLWNEGTPRTFIIVSAAWFVGVMVGWRLITLGIVWLRNRTWSADAAT